MRSLTCCSPLIVGIRLTAFRGLEQGLGWLPPVTAMPIWAQRLRLALLIACLPCIAALPRGAASNRSAEAAAAAAAVTLPADERSQVNNATLAALLGNLASPQERAVIYTTFTLGEDAAGSAWGRARHVHWRHQKRAVNKQPSNCACATLTCSECGRAGHAAELLPLPPAAGPAAPHTAADGG
jgi:hypothetical protein